MHDDAETAALPMGYFGASTGMAAALWAASELSDDVHAIVSRGGRPDLAAPRLSLVRAPTLLIVGGADTIVLGVEPESARGSSLRKRASVVPGAGHLFEEPGALESVAELATGWFVRHLTVGPELAVPGP